VDDGDLFAQDRAAILDAMNQAVSRLYVYKTDDNVITAGGERPQWR
jgi:hypothetical protein